MKHGFIRCGAMIPSIKVADCSHNESEIISLLDEAQSNRAHVLSLIHI